MKWNETHNKALQSDQTTRYARGLAADAGRYAARNQNHQQPEPGVQQVPNLSALAFQNV